MSYRILNSFEAGSTTVALSIHLTSSAVLLTTYVNGRVTEHLQYEALRGWEAQLKYQALERESSQNEQTSGGSN